MAQIEADVSYRPHSDGWEWLSALPASTVLVVGHADEAQAGRIDDLAAGETRRAGKTAAQRHLHDGAYGIEMDGAWHCLLVFGTNGPASASQGHVRTDSTHLGHAHDIYVDQWNAATSFVGKSIFSVGDLVRPLSRKTLGRVKRILRTGAGHRAEVEFVHGVLSFNVEDLEAVTGDPRTLEFWLKQDAADHNAVGELFTWLKLTHPLTDMLYSFAATKTTFKPYQFIPALKILSSSTGRLLIADEVGLGKTIEAGLIWTELEQRAPIRRALVVVPAALQIKWKQEMERRFMRPLNILKVADLKEFARALSDDEEPDLVGIISIEAIRGARDLVADLAHLNPHFDFVIVDEAHVLRNRSSRSYNVGSLLSDWSDYLVFLTATPLNLGSSDLFNLVNLLDEGAFPDPAVFEGQLRPNLALNSIARNVTSHSERSRAAARADLESIPAMAHGAALSRRPDFQRLRTLLSGDLPIDHTEVAAIKRMVGELNTLGGVLSRTRKVDVPDSKAIRIAEQIEVQWSTPERAFYDAIQSHYRDKALTSGVPMGFAMQMPLRQASSCIHVAQRRIWEREPWTTADDDIGYAFSGEPDESVENEDWDGGGAPAFRSPVELDSKLDALVARLRIARKQGMTKVLIFSFFKGTVEYLANRLSSEFRTAALHGGVPMNDREAVIQGFRSGKFDILIANQVGSEGLDFQFCNVLVNYDLPWNPMQVEQRIGRLDRFGQEFEKIFIFNMFVPGTIESEIIARLYNRIGVFERSIGDLEPIMRSTMHEISDLLMDPKLSIAQLEREVDRFSVAAKQQEADIVQLEKSGGVLTTVSQLEIDGLTDDGPTSGRYVGSSELQRLLSTLVRAHGGSLTATSRDDIHALTGTPDLAIALRSLPRPSRGAIHGVGKLAAQLRDQVPFAVAFKPEVLHSDPVELITSRHPLIRLAIESLTHEPERLSRFGAVGLASIDRSARYLARVDVARSEGVRTLCELWVTAIDLDSNERSEHIEEQLMVELAEGGFGECGSALPSNLTVALAKLDSLVSERQFVVRHERTEDNFALVDARIDSERKSISIKLDKAIEQLASHRQSRQESSYSRMLEGRVRNLSQGRDAVREKYERKRNLTLSTEFAAVVFVSGK